MAQYDDEGAAQDEGQVQETQFNLRAHLSKYNVPHTVYKHLCDESITVDELITFRTSDLDNWCDEHNLKAIERRRFLNAVKALPNAQVNTKEEINKEIIPLPIFLENEEKEHLGSFDAMKNNVTKMIDTVNDIEKKTNIENVIEEINSVCYQIQTFVENLRKNLIKQVCTIYTVCSLFLEFSESFQFEYSKKQHNKNIIG